MQCATHPLSSRVLRVIPEAGSAGGTLIEELGLRVISLGSERFSLMRRYKSNSIHLNWIILSLYPRMDVSAANE